ncbi:MAG: glycosyltransferase family 4 protein [Microscillaceae bacterium]|nr:glycosyltransferase family 4 protein [Microscillaceae bacterium]MDW8460385.1 glycosyltransferase family 4 protein [Cytophagales bacterium]
MNILHIPSWYPSENEPITGIFIQEQIALLAKHYPQHNFGVSLWGQQDYRLLLWAKDHVWNLKKMYQSQKIQSYTQEISPNCTIFFSPALTWSRKIFYGNRANILQANLNNLQNFEKKFGKVDLIHAHVGFPAGYYAFRIAQKLGIPYVITEQMSPFPFPYFERKNFRLYAPLAQAFAYSQKNIAISPALLNRMAQFGIKNLTYIPNLTDETFFYLPNKMPQNEQFTFFCLGRMVAQKGIPDLLQAFAIVLKYYPNCQLRIGGEGEMLKSYQQYAQKLGISKHISWLGLLNRTNVRNEFWQADAFVLPSLHETMGVVYAEALACGVPVVATLNGGAESVINHNEHGYLSPVSDIQELAKNMILMIQNRQKFYSQALRNYFLQRFASFAVCQQIISVYEEVAHKHKR